MVQQSNALYVRDTPANELADAHAKPASFKLQYFPIHAVGQTGRDMLTYAGAKWENYTVAPKKWFGQKADTPFGCMPVLFIKGENGKDLHLSEAIVVDTYLANQFHLMGNNPYEASLITSFYNSSAAFQSRFASTVTWVSPDAQVKGLASFKGESLPQWIAHHDRHLKANGSNGHYVGSKLSLADIRTANTIEHLACQPWGEEFVATIQESSPALYKVYETAIHHPKLAAYKASEEYAKSIQYNKEFFANPFATFA